MFAQFWKVPTNFKFFAKFIGFALKANATLLDLLCCLKNPRASVREPTTRELEDENYAVPVLRLFLRTAHQV